MRVTACRRWASGPNVRASPRGAVPGWARRGGGAGFPSAARGGDSRVVGLPWGDLKPPRQATPSKPARTLHAPSPQGHPTAAPNPATHQTAGQPRSERSETPGQPLPNRAPPVSRTPEPHTHPTQARSPLPTRHTRMRRRNQKPDPATNCARQRPPPNTGPPPDREPRRPEYPPVNHRATHRPGHTPQPHPSHAAGPQDTPKTDHHHNRQPTTIRPEATPKPPHQPGTRGCAAEIRNPPRLEAREAATTARRHPPTWCGTVARRPRE